MPTPKTFAVATPTQESFKKLMALYEIVGWRWYERQRPTEYDSWCLNKEKTHIEFSDNFRSGKDPLNGWFPRVDAIISVDEAVEKLREMYPNKFAQSEPATMTGAATLKRSSIGGWKLDEIIFDEAHAIDWTLIEKPTNQPKTSFMQSVAQTLKNLALSKVDRTLREHGLEDENGNMTHVAMDLMDDELQSERWKTRREEISEALAKADKEAKE